MTKIYTTLAIDRLRKRRRMNRKSACRYDSRVRCIVFGNALGNSLVGAINSSSSTNTSPSDLPPDQQAKVQALVDSGWDQSTATKAILGGYDPANDETEEGPTYIQQVSKTLGGDPVNPQFTDGMAATPTASAQYASAVELNPNNEGITVSPNPAPVVPEHGPTWIDSDGTLNITVTGVDSPAPVAPEPSLWSEIGSTIASGWNAVESGVQWLGSEVSQGAQWVDSKLGNVSPYAYSDLPYVSGPIPINRYSFPGAWPINSGLNTIDGAANIALNTLGAVSNFAADHQAELLTLENHAGQFGPLAEGPTVALGQFSPWMRSMFKAADGPLQVPLNGGLTDAEAGLRAPSTFSAQGLQLSGTEIAGSSQGSQLIQELKAADPNATPQQILSRAQQLIGSGVDLPNSSTATAGQAFFKLVPSGQEPTSYSPYFLSEETYNSVSSLPIESIPNALGLPQGSVARSYDVFSIAPTLDAQPTLFQSVIAPTQEGAIELDGGVLQSIIPNRSLFTSPQYVTTLGD